MVQSLYSKLYSPTTIASSRVVERFTGDTIDERWSTYNLAGGPAGLATMSDSIDGGLNIDTNDTDSNLLFGISFNNIRHYSPTASKLICIFRQNTDNVNYSSIVSLDEDSSLGTAGFIHVGQNTAANASFYMIRSDDGTSESNTATSVALDTSYHKHEVETFSTSIQYSIDGLIRITKGTNRPTLKLAPALFVQNLEATAHDADYLYLEVYNK